MAKILKFFLVVAGVGLMLFVYEYLANELNKPLVGEGFAYGNGRIEATEVAIAPKISGRVSEILVQEGDIVEKGQVLAKLDTQELQARLKLAQAQIKQAQENKKYTQAILEQKQNEFSLAQKTISAPKSFSMPKLSRSWHLSKKRHPTTRHPQQQKRHRQTSHKPMKRSTWRKQKKRR